MAECKVCHEDKKCFDWDGWAICHDCYNEGLLSCGTVDKYTQHLKDKCAALAAANRALAEALDGILHYTSQYEFFHHEHEYGCIVCAEEGITPADIKHTDKCWISKARAALAAHRANTQTAGDTPVTGTAGGRVDDTNKESES